VSKQAVGDWVKSGKVVLGADGRLDPRQAVSQLLRSTDPARLRSKVLAPLVKDMGVLQRRIAHLESELAAAHEQSSFDNETAIELLEILKEFEIRLHTEWDALHEIDRATALAALSAWLEETQKHGADPDLEILSFASPYDESEPAFQGAPEIVEKAPGLSDDGLPARSDSVPR
jgi:hypothetical protein